MDLIIPQNAAKQAAAAATQTIAAAQNAAASNKNTAAHQQLVQSCKVRQKDAIYSTMSFFFICLYDFLFFPFISFKSLFVLVL